MNQPSILVIGSANVDLVTRVSRSPRPGETITGLSFHIYPGGKGANQAVAAARLGARTVFAGCVGADEFGEMQRHTLAEAGVDVSHIKTDPDEATGTASILVADGGENTIVVAPGANGRITPADIERLDGLFAAADAVLLQLEIPLEAVEAALDAARKHGALSILDAGPAQQLPGSLLAKASIVSPNETEAQALTGLAVNTLDEARAAAEALRALGVPEVVLKLGSRGALYVGDEVLYAPAFPVNAIDTVAAGD